MTAGKLALMRYKLSDYVTRLRYSAAWLRKDRGAIRLDANELDEIADILEGLIQSPEQGSGT